MKKLIILPAFWLENAVFYAKKQVLFHIFDNAHAKNDRIFYLFYQFYQVGRQIKQAPLAQGGLAIVTKRNTFAFFQRKSATRYRGVMDKSSK